MVTKQCSACREEKPLTEFNRHPRGLYRRQGRCRACQRDYNSSPSATATRLRYQKSHPEVFAKNAARYRKAHPEACRISRARWLLRNPGRQSEIVRLSRRRHPETHRAIQARRRAHQRGAVGTVTAKEWTELKLRHGNRCLGCGRSEPEIRLTMDHVIPISKGGIHTIENIQPLCGSCNSKKGTRSIDFRLTSHHAALK